ncbi:MAG: hypothetical protein NZ735_02125, partial [Candidatus Marinimicrobia bacterium]|nr:hypothetical protein [Candidatus Neomarinimicrobiota bacterium]
SSAGSGHLAQGGHGGHGFARGQTEGEGQIGQTGGTISDFKMYIFSLPGGIFFLEIPSLEPLDVAIIVADPLSPSMVAPLIPSINDELPKHRHKIKANNRMQNKCIFSSFMVTPI